MSNSDPNKEDNLQKLFRRAPEEAIEVLFREYYPSVCRVILHIIPDPGIAEDIAQDVFFELWRKRDRINVTTSFGAYLRRSARNRSLNYIRDHKINPSGEDQLPPLADQQPNADQCIDIQDLQTQIDRAIDQLPERCRLVFTLSRFEDMSYQQIADELHISIKTVENQISKALRLLRESLGPYLSLFVGFLTIIYPG
ncbi:MAG: RNA polymerase sigma-70 factor [Saprospiraceae bacterium]